MKLRISIAILTALSFSGCTSPMSMLPTSQTQTTVKPVVKHYQQPSPEKQEAYQNTMRSVASGIQDDPNYQRITLDTPEKKAWFKDLTYRLWDRQISYSQFMSEGLSKYPDHRYEFNFVSNGFQKHS